MEIPKEQKLEYWDYSIHNIRLKDFLSELFKKGWIAHQIIPFNGSKNLDACYIILYKN